MFAGIGGFRSGLTRAGGFRCVGPVSYTHLRFATVEKCSLCDYARYDYTAAKAVIADYYGVVVSTLPRMARS